ncbi:MAG: phytoene/squalene synthase family protein [Flavobacteriales bacterium]|nr:phytoene/squalene synthase family protein [Flavobacteriales bacterium]
MKAKFDELSFRVSKITTRSYSTSFSLGIRFLGKEFHKPIYNVYGFVRFADEIVDSFHGYDKDLLLQKFEKDTYDAIEQKISLNPVLNAFQQSVHQYQIDLELIDAFLKSMKMDLQKITYDGEEYNEYIFGSAEVVGLMCLRIFSNGNRELYERLKLYARKLGSAFQKVNFLRDAKDDLKVLGRNYFPNVNLENFTQKEKKEIELDIENEFKEALIGIKMLPLSSRGGVYLAFYYYNKLFKKIRRQKVEKVMTQRIRINNFQKMVFLVNSYLRFQFNALKQ